MKGKWAQGIVPRNFAWVIKDQLAVCERPGGYGSNHRKVRRQEEIIWIREQGFAPVISLLPSPHNLHAYDELGVEWLHHPFAKQDDPIIVLQPFWSDVQRHLAEGHKVIVHHDALDDIVEGAIAGYLLYAGLVAEEPRAVAMVEHVLQRQMGPPARQIAVAAARLARRGR